MIKLSVHITKNHIFDNIIVYLIGTSRILKSVISRNQRLRNITFTAPC